jgi:hypothetical protein
VDPEPLVFVFGVIFVSTELLGAKQQKALWCMAEST